MDCLYLSLCIPTNGVVEWVFPVLDSIYADKIPEDSFEVVITDNGNNEEFRSKISDYRAKHTNITYAHTEAVGFLNQIEAFKLAKGKLIKFVNHRMVFLLGAVKYLVDFSKQHGTESPGVYFANGHIKGIDGSCVCDDFDAYTKAMGYESSWSGGTAIWLEDFKNISKDEQYDFYFPHLNLVFAERKKNKYIVDNKPLSYEIETGAAKKSTYDMFYAFAVDYPAFMLDMRRSGDITTETFLSVKKSMGDFIAAGYTEYMLLKKENNFDLSSFDTSCSVFFDTGKIKRKAYIIWVKRAFRKALKILGLWKKEQEFH